MTYLHFIGIDISKNRFDVVCLAAEAVGEAKDRPHRARQFANNPDGFSAFCKAYARQLPHAFAVLESTGGYENALIAVLQAHQVAVHRASPLQAKHFIRSLGKRAKTDALDACALARYGQERHAHLPCMPPAGQDEVQRELAYLTACRSDLVAMQVMERQRLQHPNYATLAQYVTPVLEVVAAQIAAVEARIKALIAASEAMQQQMEVMTRVKGVGIQTATTLLATMPELGTLTRRQAASLAGCAPHARDSGTQRGYRRTGGGRNTVKRALFMAAMSARRFNPQLRSFYERLVQNGKKPMVALTAVMRKLITILNAKIRDAKLQTSW